MNIHGLKNKLKRKRLILRQEMNRPKWEQNRMKIKQLMDSMQRIRYMIKDLKQDRKKHK